ncbi:MAG: PepSY domain-containing protein [Corynebacterium sp.]|uniref:PepSY domain-containing protein n=1 Tax=Corynebacterium sp. TaxID=1720 RepID=UPI003F9D2612
MSVSRKSLLAAVLGASLLIAGCGSGGDGEAAGVDDATLTFESDSGGSTGDASPGTADEPTENPSSTGGAAATGAADAASAIGVALEHRPGSAVVEVDHEDDDNVWEVTVDPGDGRGVEVYIAGASGDVIGEEGTSLDSDQRGAPTVTAAEAIGIALGERSGRVEGLTYDSDDGRRVWEAVVIDGGTEWEIHIDPGSGDVLHVSQDD